MERKSAAYNTFGVENNLIRGYLDAVAFRHKILRHNSLALEILEDVLYSTRLRTTRRRHRHRRLCTLEVKLAHSRGLVCRDDSQSASSGLPR